MIRYILLTSLFIVFNLSKLYSQINWTLVKDSDNIKVYIAEDDQDDQFINIKAVTQARGSVASFAQIMYEVENYKQWMHAVEETFVVAQKTDYHFSYYMLTDFPWPAQDRDAVINMKFDWNPEKKTFVTYSKNVNGIVPIKEDIQRVEEVQASYTFIQKNSDRVEIKYQGRIKPGVQLPEWLMERVYHIAPYNTLKNLRELVLKDDYRQASFDLDKI
jgi:hypothetical protein